jgi:hypothetical protein
MVEPSRTERGRIEKRGTIEQEADPGITWQCQMRGGGEPVGRVRYAPASAFALAPRLRPAGRLSRPGAAATLLPLVGSLPSAGVRIVSWCAGHVGPLPVGAKGCQPAAIVCKRRTPKEF